MKLRKITEEMLDYVRAICLDPSVGLQTREAMQDAMNTRACWIKKMMKKGLEILAALEKPRHEKIHYKWAGDMLHADLAVQGMVPMGLVESLPIEYAPEPVKGKDSLFIDCIWVLPPFWRTGVAKRLTEAVVQRAKQFGGASVLAYDGDRWFGTSIEYMPISFFKRFRFKEVARDGSRVLLSLDLGAKKPPELIYPKTKTSSKNNRIAIDVLFNNQCPWSTLMIDNIRKNVKKYPEVTLNVVNTNQRKTIMEYGLSRGVYINGEPVIKRMASWKEIKARIEKTRNKLQ